MIDFLWFNNLVKGLGAVSQDLLLLALENDKVWLYIYPNTSVPLLDILNSLDVFQVFLP